MAIKPRPNPNSVNDFINAAPDGAAKPQQNKKEIKVLSHRMPMEMWQRLEAMAAHRGLTVTAMINSLIADSLDGRG